VIYDPQTETAKVEVVRQRPTGWVSLQSISPIAWNAVVISEDAAFWTHNGFDWNQMWDAFETNLKTAQVRPRRQHHHAAGNKKCLLTKEKTVIRKAKEAFLTMRIERHLSKKRILEIYLNIAEFGPGVYGIGHASEYYFQKQPSRLNAKEGAFLAILLPSPKRYSVSFRKKALTPFARDAIRGVLEKLMAVKKLSGPEFEAAVATPMGFEATQMPAPAQAPSDEDQAPEDELETPTEGAEAI